jgi:hypothetical protein
MVCGIQLRIEGYQSLGGNAMSARVRRDFVLTVCLFVVSMATVWADAEPVIDEAPVAAAIVTDQPAAELSPEDVAREVLRLQEEMGGSIVTDLDTAPDWSETQRPQLRRADWNQPRPSTRRNTTPTAVNILRETARQLEQSAHQLESLDLYPQADGLREMADSLRHDARKLRAEALSERPNTAVE